MTHYHIIGAILAIWIISRIIERRRRRGKIVHLTSELCTACGRCTKRCKHHVFELVKEEKKSRLVATHLDKCTACGDCVKTCKFKALKIVSKHTQS
ncbi:MAG: 4Fe-4S binding protein [Prevotellaceae bacterium]|nr:4Fe-4S binding protein [Prevotellaceae bacterium]